MFIDGFRHIPRSGADRADDAKRAGRSAEGTTPGSVPGTENGNDSLESSIAGFIDVSVREAARELDSRVESIVARRDELLARADDPQAIRRAAQSFLQETSGV